MDTPSTDQLESEIKELSAAVSLPADSSNIEIPLKASRDLAVGRHLSFAINDESIEMAASIRIAGRTKLLTARKYTFPSSDNSRDHHKSETLTAISNFAKEYGGRKPIITLVVSGPSTISRNMIMPKLNGKDLDSAILFEAKRQIPFRIEDCYFSYRVISEIKGPALSKVKVALVACLKNLIDKQLALFGEFKFEVARIVHGQEALANLLPFIGGFDSSKSYSLLDIQKHRSLISYYRGNTLEFSHIISLGSSFLAHREDATMFEYFAESLAGEIQNSIDYYTGQHTTGFGNSVYVHGDLSTSSEFIDLLSDRFGFDFKQFPVQELSFGNSKSEGLKSLPLCLAAAAPTVARIRPANLLPPIRLAKLALKKINRLCATALILVVISLTFALFSQQQRFADAQTNHETLKISVAELQNSELYKTYHALQKQIAMDEAYLLAAEAPLSFLGENLKELSIITPTGIRLYDFEARNDQTEQNFYFSGVASSLLTPPEIMVAEYVQILEASLFYENVTVVRFHKKKVGERFELDFQIAMKGRV
ncbi:MAG: pilus assembly protein PilM [candidate division Zixibacteria bacterium]|nr:pilus assembly protein PilM [candidate division Zixibacteria bacterium]